MELPIASRTVLDERGSPRRYHYSLLVEPVEAEGFFWENYGVGVREENGACTRIPGITASAVRIDELMSLLVEHKVGPTTLHDVVEDWL